MISLFKVHHPKGIGEKIEELFIEGILTEGEYSTRFENELKLKLKTNNLSLTNSGTSALALAFRLCGLERGDEVITSPMTCMATNEPIFNCGAKLVWADIDPTTGNIDPNDVEKKITDKTKAIVGVHWGGQPFDVDSLSSFKRTKQAEDYPVFYEENIPVIEDAAHALGATYKGKPAGTVADYGCFSFQAIKHLTTADGGLLFCKNDNQITRAKKLRWFGLDRGYEGPKWEQDIPESGYKYHMNNLNALIGLEQLKYIDEIIERHKENCKRYDQSINNKKVKLLNRPKWSETSSWIYSLLVDEKPSFEKYMRENGVACDSVHVRNDTYSVFKDFRGKELLGVTEFTNKMTNIPVGWWLSEENIEKVIATVNNY